MLVGGPIGISFIAIAAVPAIIIGLPVWIGRKVGFCHVDYRYLIIVI